MSTKWQDYTLRVRGRGRLAHLAFQLGGNSTACRCGCLSGGWTLAPDDWSLCKACARAIESAKRRPV